MAWISSTIKVKAFFSQYKSSLAFSFAWIDKCPADYYHHYTTDNVNVKIKIKKEENQNNVLLVEKTAFWLCSSLCEKPKLSDHAGYQAAAPTADSISDAKRYA